MARNSPVAVYTTTAHAFVLYQACFALDKHRLAFNMPFHYRAVNFMAPYVSLDGHLWTPLPESHDSHTTT